MTDAPLVQTNLQGNKAKWKLNALLKASDKYRNKHKGHRRNVINKVVIVQAAFKSNIPNISNYNSMLNIPERVSLFPCVQNSNYFLREVRHRS